jgi:hypothetical protein
MILGVIVVAGGILRMVWAFSAGSFGIVMLTGGSAVRSLVMSAGEAGFHGVRASVL